MERGREGGREVPPYSLQSYSLIALQPHHPYRPTASIICRSSASSLERLLRGSPRCRRLDDAAHAASPRRCCDDAAHATTLLMLLALLDCEGGDGGFRGLARLGSSLVPSRYVLPPSSSSSRCSGCQSHQPAARCISGTYRAHIRTYK